MYRFPSGFDCPPRRKSSVERLKAKVESLLSTVENPADGPDLIHEHLEGDTRRSRFGVALKPFRTTGFELETNCQDLSWVVFITGFGLSRGVGALSYNKICA